MTRALVVTRTRDRGLFLERAIRSVQAQTLEDHVHVVVNDGGDPEAVRRALSATGGDRDERVRVVHNPQSLGLEAASNRGITLAGSDFVAVHDDDDSWHPECLERATGQIEQAARDGRPEVHGVVVRTDRIEEVIEGDRILERSRSTLYPRMRVVSLYEQCTAKNQLTPIAFVYTRQAYDALGGYDESLRVTGDWDFGIRFLLDYEVDYLDPGFALAGYHKRPFDPRRKDNSSFAGNDLHRVTSTRLMNRYLRQELKEGRLGVGYLMSSLKHEDDRLAALARSVLPRRLISAAGRRWFGGS